MYFKNVSKMHNHVSFICMTFSCYVFSNNMDRLFPDACLFNLAIQTDAAIKCNGPLLVVFVCFVLVLDFISRIISRISLVHPNSSLSWQDWSGHKKYPQGNQYLIKSICLIFYSFIYHDHSYSNFSKSTDSREASWSFGLLRLALIFPWICSFWCPICFILHYWRRMISKTGKIFMKCSQAWSWESKNIVLNFCT